MCGQPCASGSDLEPVHSYHGKYEFLSHLWLQRKQVKIWTNAYNEIEVAMHHKNYILVQPFKDGLWFDFLLNRDCCKSQGLLDTSASSPLPGDQGDIVPEMQQNRLQWGNFFIQASFSNTKSAFLPMIKSWMRLHLLQTDLVFKSICCSLVLPIPLTCSEISDLVYSYV